MAPMADAESYSPSAKARAPGPLMHLRKYLLDLPLGRTTESFAGFVHDEVPQDSAETIFVSLGSTVTVRDENNPEQIPALYPQISLCERQNFLQLLLPIPSSPPCLNRVPRRGGFSMCRYRG